MGSQNNEREKHNVFLYDKNRISITGVTDVQGFDEGTSVASVCDGSVLTVEGSGLSISVLDLEKGLVEGQGEVTALYYSDNVQKPKTNLFSLIFRGK